ncbi:hypothetical protein DR864_13270 [Runella rosea]|uniref:HTH LytTR-type domain-containing protein n=1 Tax=Runella rosea TaxID=2259595 RepID=A0A344TJ32_9BACT|nr:LytTR family DNA-binding domain-containing protein [Runella rosea]AXE18653.1 hypothetical protein DR864_13270 [Runella rosea]
MNNLSSLLSPAVSPDYLELVNLKRSFFIRTEDVIFIQADVNYVRIVTKTGKVFVQAKTLKSYEQLLKKTSFVRTHKSYLVNFHHFAGYQITDGGTFIQLLDGKKVPVSKRRRQYVQTSVSQKQNGVN